MFRRLHRVTIHAFQLEKSNSENADLTKHKYDILILVQMILMRTAPHLKASCGTQVAFKVRKHSCFAQFKT